jgi:hypothetical protein
MTQRRLVGCAIAVAVVVAAVAVVQLRPRHGTSRIKHLLDWSACVSIETHDAPGVWPHAEQHRRLVCQNLGPTVEYARFAGRAQLRTDLLAHPPDDAVCVYGDGKEVAVNGLEAHQFPRLCAKLGGRRVDGVVGLPELPSGNTAASIDRAITRQRRRDAAAERAALVRYFAAAG